MFEWWSGETSTSVGLTADVLNFFAPVTKVDFYEVDYLIGTATQAPYSVLYQYASVGQHQIVVLDFFVVGLGGQGARFCHKPIRRLTKKVAHWPS